MDQSVFEDIKNIIKNEPRNSTPVVSNNSSKNVVEVDIPIFDTSSIEKSFNTEISIADKSIETKPTVVTKFSGVI